MLHGVRSSRSLGPRAILATAGAVAAGLLLAAAASVDRAGGGVYRLRLGDLDLYARPDVRPTASIGGGLVLIVVAGMAATAHRVTLTTDDGGRRRRFFLGSAIGAAILGLDDLVGLHESIGLTAAGWLPGTPSPDRVGHLVLAVYALLATAWFWRFRDLVRRSRSGAIGLAVAVAASLTVTLLDVVLHQPPHAVTSPLQVAAAVGLLVGYWSLIGELVIAELP